MRADAVSALACPDTGAPLTLEVTAREGEEILEGALVGPAGQRFPVRGGVPRFVDTDRLEADQRATVESFAFKWKRIPNYAFEAKTKANREAWYFQRFGFARGDADVRQFLAGATRVLEAGTGTGVDTEMLARNTDATIFGIDISSAIDEAYRRFRGHPRIVLCQADIGRLPFRPGTFDVVSCDQVLHHTPDPPGNFGRLARLLTPTGRMLLYVYRIKGALREFADDHLRALYVEAPVEQAVDFSERIARFGKALSGLNARVDLPDDLPELGIKKGSYDVQRLIYDHVIKCFWNDDYDFETNAMVNFDWYRPKHAYRYTEAEVRGWAAVAGLAVQHFDESPSGLSAILGRS